MPLTYYYIANTSTKPTQLLSMSVNIINKSTLRDTVEFEVIRYEVIYK